MRRDEKIFATLLSLDADLQRCTVEAMKSDASLRFSDGRELRPHGAICLVATLEHRDWNDKSGVRMSLGATHRSLVVSIAREQDHRSRPCMFGWYVGRGRMDGELSEILSTEDRVALRKVENWLEEEVLS